MIINRSTLKDLVYQVNGAAIEVHKSIGAGLLENVCHQCLKKELELRKINFSSELEIPLNYKGYQLESKLRCDL
jgi:GxxExxY protein